MAKVTTLGVIIIPIYVTFVLVLTKTFFLIILFYLFAANLLRDRYESLQRRGALAASKLMMKKKKNLKSYFKPGHKVTEQEVERYIAKTRGAGNKLSSSL